MYLYYLLNVLCIFNVWSCYFILFRIKKKRKKYRWIWAFGGNLPVCFFFRAKRMVFSKRFNTDNLHWLKRNTRIFLSTVNAIKCVYIYRFVKARYYKALKTLAARKKKKQHHLWRDGTDERWFWSAIHHFHRFQTRSTFLAFHLSIFIFVHPIQSSSFPQWRYNRVYGCVQETFVGNARTHKNYRKSSKHRIILSFKLKLLFIYRLWPIKRSVGFYFVRTL